MKEDWKSLVGKRVLLKRRHTAKIDEATIVEVSESGKYVKFKWMSGGESWEEPEDVYNFSYNRLLEVLGKAEPTGHGEKEEVETARIVFPSS